ncbi:unnamed protein product [Polarella glacialis]|uniref:Choline transporter-like protein n=1 Tax=Polarella glacialis TaxID=89957 RepID=A0A813JNT0_POLGL|nr:unnamed protein product [Polarella glacialis]
MQGSRSRAATPPPRQLSSRGPQTGLASFAEQTSQLRRAEQQTGLAKTGQPASQSTAGLAARKCTDLPWLLALLLFVAGVASLGRFAIEHKDLRRLTRGFDHRGQLCGANNRTWQRDLVYWCAGPGEAVDWAAPVCIGACPEQGDMVLCPGQLQVSEEEQGQESGAVILLRVEKQLLTPQAVPTATRLWMHGYCISKDLQPGRTLAATLQTALETAALVDSNWTFRLLATALPQAVASFESLVAAPRLLAVCVLVAVLLSLMQLACLHCFAGLFMRLTLLCTGLASCLAGLLLLAMPGASNAIGLCWSLPALATGTQLAELARRILGAEPAAVLVQAAANLELKLTALTEMLSSTDIPAPVGLGSYLPVVAGCTGAALVLGGLAFLICCMVARRSLAVASDCISESCALLFGMPSLLLLPLAETFFSLVAVLLLMVGLPIILSMAEVKGETILGVSGLYRHFDVGLCDVGRLAVWAFACLWAQELIGAVTAFALAYATATWYFCPGRSLLEKGRHLLLPPAIRGLCLAVTCHLGSLACGSFFVALLRFLRWVTFLAEQLLCKRRDRSEPGDRQQCCGGIAMACQALLAFLQAWAEFLSRYAYIDVALSSKPYAAAASQACDLLRSHAGVVSMLSFMSGLFCFAGPLAISAVAYCMAAHALAAEASGDHLARLSSQLEAEGASFGARFVAAEVSSLRLELLQLSPEMVALAAASTALLVSRAVLTALDGAARTLLYCFLWDLSDGAVDAAHVPRSFRAFADTHGLKSERK